MRAPVGLTLALVAAVSLTTFGCGESSDTVIDATADNPCTVVKAPEITAALKVERVGAGTDKDVQATLQGERVCQFQGTDVQGRPSVLKVGLVTDLAAALFDKYREQHQQAVNVPGLGDRAIWDDPTSTLLVLDGKRVVTVLVFGPSVPDRRAAAVTVATRALERLG